MALDSQEELVVVADDSVVRPGSRNFRAESDIIARILYQKLPLVRRVLQGVQVKCYQIVEEIALNLASEDVYPRAQDIQGMPITP